MVKEMRREEFPPRTINTEEQATAFDFSVMFYATGTSSHDPFARVLGGELSDFWCQRRVHLTQEFTGKLFRARAQPNVKDNHLRTADITDRESYMR